MKFYAVEVVWYPDETDHPGACIDHLLIAAKDNIEVCQQMRDYYGEDCIETLCIHCLNPENGFIRVPRAIHQEVELNGEV